MVHIVEGLVAFREDTSVGPMLAESWTVSNGRQDLHLPSAPGRQIPQRRHHDGRRRRLVVEALARSGDAMALPVGVRRPAASHDRERARRPTRRPSSSRSTSRRRCSFRPWRGPIAARPPSSTATSSDRTANGSRRSAPGRSSSASGSAASTSIWCASTATSRAPSRATAIPAPRTPRSIACASTSSPTARPRRRDCSAARSMSSTASSIPDLEDLKSRTGCAAQHHAHARRHRHPVPDQGSAAERRAHPPRHRALARHRARSSMR